jgi:hypothetical protein
MIRKSGHRFSEKDHAQALKMLAGFPGHRLVSSTDVLPAADAGAVSDRAAPALTGKKDV